MDKIFPKIVIVSDRTLKYGRNVLVIGSMIFTLTFIPNINVTDFEPFGYSFTDKGETSFWVIIFFTLAYHYFQFGFNWGVDVESDHQARVVYFDNPDLQEPNYLNTPSDEEKKYLAVDRGSIAFKSMMIDIFFPSSVGLSGIIISLINIFIH